MRTRGEAPRVRVRLVVSPRCRVDCDAIDLEADIIRINLCEQLHINISRPSWAAWRRRRRRRRRRRGRGRGRGRRWGDLVSARLHPDLLLDASIAAAAVLVATTPIFALIPFLTAVGVAIFTINVGPLGAVIFFLVDAWPEPLKNACSARVLSARRGKQDA